MPRRRAAAIALAIVAATGASAALAAATAGAARADAAAGPPRGRVELVRHTPLDDAPTRGPVDAPVTVEVFFAAGSDLGNQAYARAMRLWRRHPGRVRLVFRVIRKPDASGYVAPVALLAHVRGRFFELMDQLVARPGPAPLPPDVIELAAAVGVAEAASVLFGCPPGCAVKLALDDILDDNLRRSARARIGPRAELVLNGRLLGPTPDEATLEAAYQAALALAKVELAAGARPSEVPALTARRLRCADRRARARGRLPSADDDRATPVAGWHLGTLAANGTGCVAENPPAGPVEHAFDFDPGVTDQPGAFLLERPLSTMDLPSHGPEDAPVVIQVVCNLRSASCAEQRQRADKVLRDYWPYVRVVYRPWVDLGQEGSELELPLAAEALCAQRLGGGWRYLRERAGADATVGSAATRAGLDLEPLDACAQAATADARRLIDEARTAGIRRVPTLVVGQRAYVGGLTDDRWLKDLVDVELAPGLLGGTSDGAIDDALEDWARTIPPYRDDPAPR